MAANCRNMSHAVKIYCHNAIKQMEYQQFIGWQCVCKDDKGRISNNQQNLNKFLFFWPQSNNSDKMHKPLMKWSLANNIKKSVSGDFNNDIIFMAGSRHYMMKNRLQFMQIHISQRPFSLTSVFFAGQNCTALRNLCHETWCKVSWGVCLKLMKVYSYLVSRGLGY